MYGSLQACVEGIGEVVGNTMDQCHFKGTLDTATKEAAAHEQALFLEWYSEQLFWHGERILESAKAIFWGSGTKLSAKVPKALDCHCKDISLSRPAQMLVVSGCLYNDGYLRVMRMFGRHGITLNFTCSETSSTNVAPQPAGVFQQMTLKAAFQAHNSDSTRCSQDQIIMPKSVERSKHCGYGSLLCSLILIRMTRQLFLSDAWHAFVKFLEDRSRRAFSSSHHVSTPFLQQQSSM
jgi:beta-amylase